MNKLLAFILLAISTLSIADIEVPDAVMDQIISDVIQDEGFYDAAEVHARVIEWQVNQTQPEQDAAIVEVGNCSGSCTQSGGNNSLPEPRNVKIKGKGDDGNYYKHIVIKWKRPQALPEGSDLKLKNYRVIVSKDGETFKKYKVKAKFKGNGKPKKKQKLKLRNLEAGTYTVQVKAKYKSTAQTKAVNQNTYSTSSNSSSLSSGWSNEESGTIGGSYPATIETLQTNRPNLYQCAISNGYQDHDVIEDVTNLICTNKGLTNADTAGLMAFTGLVQLGLRDNPLITDNSFLGYSSLDSLTWLDLTGNTGLDINTGSPLQQLDSLTALYLRQMQLTALPALPDTLELLNINDNNIESSEVIPQGTSLVTFIMDRNKDSNGDYNIGDSFFEGLIDVDIKSIKMRGSAISQVNAYRDVIGLENLVLKHGNFDATQDFGQVSGFCSLTLSNTDITEIQNKRPIQFLTLKDNAQLKTADLLKRDWVADNGDVVKHSYQPLQFDMSGSSAFACTAYYEFSESTETILSNFSDVPAFNLSDGSPAKVPNCPIVRLLHTKTMHDFCKPDALEGLNLISHNSSGFNYINWNKDPAHDYVKWGVTHFRISALQNGVITSSIDQAVNEPWSVSEHNPNVDEYMVQACNADVCGYELKSNAFEAGGLGAVTPLNVRWVVPAQEQFNFQLTYDINDFNGYLGKPDYFEITPLINNAPSQASITIDVIDDHVPQWDSLPLDRVAYPEYLFSVRACRGDIGCGPVSYVEVLDPEPFAPEVSIFKVYEDALNERRYITWDIDEQSLSITHYNIRSYVGNTINNEYVVSVNDPDYLIIQDPISTKYDIQACSDDYCGEYIVDSNGFDPGLIKPEDLYVNWVLDNTAFNITFKYDQNRYLTEGGKPEYFKILATVPQADGSFLLDTIYVAEGDDPTVGWPSKDLIRNEVLGSSFNVEACNENLGCSYFESIAVTEPIVQSSDIPKPNFNHQSAVVYNAVNDTVTLSWTFESGANTDLVDYIAVYETQPKMREQSGIGATILDGSQQIYQTHRIDSPLVLDRYGRGWYKYKIKACKAADENQPIDVCSDFADVSNNSNNQQLVEIPKCYNGQSGCQLGGISGDVISYTVNGNKHLKWQVSGNTIPIDYFVFYGTQPRGTGDNDSGMLPVCHNVYRDGNNNNTEVPNDLQRIKIPANNFTIIDGYYTTEGVCEGLLDIAITNENYSDYSYVEITENTGLFGYFTMTACSEGQGCTIFGTTSNAVQGEPITRSIPQFNGSAGPGLFRPGSYWHPGLDGTGWNFFWANGLNKTAQDGRYGRTYDLVGYWFTFRKHFEGTDIHDQVWTPTWMETRLKEYSQAQICLEDGSCSIYKSFVGTLLSHKWVTSNDLDLYPNGGYTIEREVGRITLWLNTSDDQDAIIDLDLDYSSGMFTSIGETENIYPYIRTPDNKLRLQIEDIGKLIQGNYVPDNDGDHYSGLWQNGIQNPEAPLSSAKLSMVTWIRGGLETSAVLYYDNHGEPFWATTQSKPQFEREDPNCTGNNCTVVPTNEPIPTTTFFTGYITPEDSTANLFTVPNGYNPLGQMPTGWVVEENILAFGDFGRAFEREEHDDPNFTEAGLKVFANEYLHQPLQGDYVRNIGISHGGSFPANDNDANYDDLLLLEKRANFHGIFYQVNDGDINATNCDPDVLGTCAINVTWYTDDQFNVTPYVKKNNGGYQVLNSMPGCEGTLPPDNTYEFVGYVCNFTAYPGDYMFQLRKDKYGVPNQQITIAQSKLLTIDDCESGACSDGYQPEYAASVNPINHTLVSDAASSTVGFTSGQFAVDMSGAATYTVPIYTPQGTGGLSPSLALSYNSHGTNGVAGLGWSISGTSSITRCLRNKEQDGIQLEDYNPITLTNEDAFCLDGQKLLQVPNNIENGESGAEYRTELESFSRIKVIGQSLNGPNTFEVRSKNGEIRTYGSPGTEFNAQVRSADGTAVVTWLLNKIADRHGNEMWFVWDTSVIGETYLSRVEYTHHEDFTNPQNVIVFDYETRADQSLGYSLVSVNKNHKRLNKVLTKRRLRPGTNLEVVRMLDLSYDNSPLSNQSRVVSIKECADDLGTNCLQPVSFDWSSDGTEQFFTEYGNSSGIGRMQASMGTLKPIDINGDGVTEFVFPFYKETGGTNPEVRFAMTANTNLVNLEGSDNLDSGDRCSSTFAGFFNKTCNMDIQPTEPEDFTMNSNDYYVYDFNGDGLDDLLSPTKRAGSFLGEPDHDTNSLTSDANWTISFSNGQKLCQNESAGSNCKAKKDLGVEWFPNAHAQTFADFTGDGLPDLMAFTVEGHEDGYGLYTDLLTTQAYLYESVYDPSEGQIEFGDGRAPITVSLDLSEIPINDYQMWCTDNTGEYPNDYRPCNETEYGGTFFSQVSSISPTASDFNGDGISDLLVTYRYLMDMASCQEPGSNRAFNEDNYCWVKIWAVHSYVPTSATTGSLQFIQNLGVSTSGWPIWVSGNLGETVTDFDFEEVGLTNFGTNEDISVVDVNGDYLADITTTKGVYLNENGQFNQLIPFNIDYSQAMNTTFYSQEEMDEDFKYLVKHVDVDNDGDLDVLFPEPEEFSGPVNYSYKTLEYSESSGYYYSSIKEPSPSIIARENDKDPQNHTHMFIDINGDSYVDHFMVKKAADSDEDHLKIESFAKQDWKARDKIIAINRVAPDGSVDDTHITFESASLPTVYARSVGSASNVWGNGTTVLDLKSSTYLVRQVDQKSPAVDVTSSPGVDLPGHYASVVYHYKGMKLQGGGRGSLGFAEMSSVDLVNKIGTQTIYKQAFPDIGKPEYTLRFHYPSLNLAPTDFVSCEIGDSDCDIDHCLGDNCFDPVIDGITADPISEAFNVYSLVYPASSAGSTFSYLSSSEEGSYELLSDTPHAINETEITYNVPANPALFYGDVASTTTRTCDGFTDGACNAVTEIETSNEYHANDQDAEKWIIGRLSKSTVNKYRLNRLTGQMRPVISNTSDFEYDPITGQLTEEIVNKNAGNDQYLKTKHIYDDYGNETNTLMCSKDVVGTDPDSDNCHVDYLPPVVFENQLHIFNHSKTDYDGFWHQYPINSYEFFGHKDSVASLIKTSEIDSLDFDIFGNPTKVKDSINNVFTHYSYGAFGEVQSSKSSTGVYAETFKYWCSENAGLHCPDAAVMVTISETEGAPISREYLDQQGRVIRTQTQSMGDEPNPGAWTTVDTEYDKAGRSARSSMPYFIKTNGDSVTTPKFNENIYDDLGRLTTTRNPSHTGETAVSTTQYNGLTTTSFNARGQKEVTVKDVSGQVIIKNQYLDNLETIYNSIEYHYDGSDNLVEMFSDGISTTMEYDSLGRKTSMTDPSKGFWTYEYNAVNSLIEQTDANNQTINNVYDVKGRLVRKTGQNLVGSQPIDSTWHFDQAGKWGKLTQETSIIRNQSDAEGDRERIDRYFTYDNFGRSSQVRTLISDGEQGDLASEYIEETRYDELGRVFMNIDATGFGTLMLYDEYGYQYKIMEASICYDSVNSNNNNSTGTCELYEGNYHRPYYEAMAMDPFGNVIKESLHDGSLYKIRNHHTENGFLQNTCISTSSSAACDDFDPMNSETHGITFTFDKIGNLRSRNDRNQSEEFTYDELNRIETESRTFGNSSPYEKSYAYDINGNLVTRNNITLNSSDTLNYDNLQRPYGVTSYKGKDYHYDDVGNVTSMTEGVGNDLVYHRSMVYTGLSKPYWISNTVYTENSTTEFAAYFQYDAAHSRYVRKDLIDGEVRRTTHYIGGVEMIRDGAFGGRESYKRYIGDLIIDVPAKYAYPSSWKFNYQLKDHIGSVHTSIKLNRAGNVADQDLHYSFDAWGKRRFVYDDTDLDINGMTATFSTEITVSTRGYTGHEHLDNLGIIHMNGRIYDPELGRFLQADPIIQDPYNTQSLNRYSYVWNNPLSNNDPTGYWSSSAFWRNWGGTVGSIVVNTVIPGSGIMASMFKGALVGAATGGEKGALIGAFSAAVFHGIGDHFEDLANRGGGSLSGPQTFAKILAHGMAGGAMNMLQGGKFGHGFASAGATQAVAPGISKIPGHKSGRIAIAAIVGGTISELTGGKFRNGAVTAAFSRAFNDEQHDDEFPLTQYDKTSGLEGTAELWDACAVGGLVLACVQMYNRNQADLKIAISYSLKKAPSLSNKIDGLTLNGEEIKFVYDQEYIDIRSGRVGNFSGHMTLAPSYPSFDAFFETFAHELWHAVMQTPMQRLNSSFMGSLPYFGNYKDSGFDRAHYMADQFGKRALDVYLIERDNEKK